jgi:aconitate hydratase
MGRTRVRIQIRWVDGWIMPFKERVMGENLVEKILRSHLVEGDYLPGREIKIRVDQTLVHDATGTMAFLQFEAMGLDGVRNDLSVVYIDHNTQQVGFENNDDHLYLQSVASKFGAVYSRAGNGICHQVHLERFGKPGTTLLGADSHTPTGGGIGQIGVGAGGLDVAVAMGTGLYCLVCPRVYLVRLSGRLPDWVTAKDVVLQMLRILSTKGNVGVMLEYGGDGVRSLSVPERATIANMGAEMGVTSSVFPSDQNTLRFLRAQAREKDWVELCADPDAGYERVIDVDLSQIEPLVAVPHSPGNVRRVSEVEGIAVDQVCIGSCTNSSYKDLMTAARILKGKTVHPRVSLGIAPGSRQILLALAQEGALTDLIRAGARIKECACTFCIGNEFSPRSGGVSVRTSNRNFEGRSGTRDAQVYLTSVETAVAAAIKGELVDPRSLEMDYPRAQEPDLYLVDQSMFLFPAPGKREVSIFRGPNIGDPPRNEPMPHSLDGEVMIKLGDKVTTDHITPAGPRLKYRSNIAKYSEFVFENLDPSFPRRCMENKHKQIHNIIVAGESYGQGSSREHAAMCPMYLGIKAVIAKSFERIHMANLVNFGILPLVFKDASEYEAVQKGHRLCSGAWREALAHGRPILIRNQDTGRSFECTYSLSDAQRRVILAGGLLNQMTSG